MILFAGRNIFAKNYKCSFLKEIDRLGIVSVGAVLLSRRWICR